MRQSNRHDVWLDTSYTCFGCGCEYRYRLKVNVSAKSESDAIKRANWKVEDKGLPDIPCPECGRIIAPSFLLGSKTSAIVMCVLAMIAASVLMTVLLVLPLDRLAGAAATGVLASFAILNSVWRIATRNKPNATRREKAVELVACDRVHSVRTAAVEPRSPVVGGLRESLWAHVLPWFCAVAMSVSGVLLPLCDGYNPDVLPRFVGPGDEFEHDPECGIRSVQGHWRGFPVADARTDPDGARVNVAAEDHEWKWAEKIWVRPGEVAVVIQPRFKFKLPPDPNLSGKTIRMELKARVEYAELSGREEYKVESSQIESRFSLLVSSPEKSRWFRGSWIGSAILATVCTLVPPLIRLFRISTVRPGPIYEVTTSPAQS